MPPSSQLIHRCAVRSWMSAAAAMSVAFSFSCHKPITNNHSRGRNLLSSKIELLQSVNMANCWPKRAAQCTQLKRCSPLSHRSRGSTVSLPHRGHVTSAGQRNCRNSVAERSLPLWNLVEMLCQPRAQALLHRGRQWSDHLDKAQGLKDFKGAPSIHDNMSPLGA